MFSSKLGKFFILIGIIFLCILFYERFVKISNKNNIQTDTKRGLSIFDDLFNCSDEQLLIDESILLRTIKFMIEETDELDPKLVEFVRSIIHKPIERKKLNLQQKQRKDFSQIGQSKFIDEKLNSRRNGFFIEAGGFNGEDHSVI